MDEVERLEAEIEEVRAELRPLCQEVVQAKRNNGNVNGELADAKGRLKCLTKRYQSLRFQLEQARRFQDLPSNN